MMTITMASRTARANFRTMLDKVMTGTDVIIERNGKNVAAVISLDSYLALQEALSDLRDAAIAKRIFSEWQNNPATAESIETVKAEFVAQGLLDA